MKTTGFYFNVVLDTYVASEYGSGAIPVPPVDLRDDTDDVVAQCPTLVEALLRVFGDGSVEVLELGRMTERKTITIYGLLLHRRPLEGSKGGRLCCRRIGICKWSSGTLERDMTRTPVDWKLSVREVW